DLITLGPATAIVNNIPIFNNTNGDIGDSLKSINDITTVATPGASGVLASFTGNGNEINDSTLLASSVLNSSGNSNPTVQGRIPYKSDTGNNAEIGWTTYSLPPNDGTLDQFLQTNGNGAVTWSSFALPSSKGASGQVLVSDGAGLSAWSAVGNGDVIGIGTSTDNFVPVYNGTNGKQIRSSGVDFDTLVQGPSTSVTENLATFVDGIGNIKDSGIALSQLGDVTGPASSTDFHAAVYDGPTGKLIKQTTFALPSGNGANGQVLATDGNGVTSWTNSGSGNVTGPSPSTQNAVALYGNATGDQLINSDITYIANEFNVPIAISTENLKINGSASGAVDLLVAPSTSSYSIELPTSAPSSSGQILATQNSSGKLKWTTAGNGDVVGPASVSVDGNLAAFDSTSGKLIKDSLIPMSSVVTGPNGTADRVALYTGTLTGIKETSYTIPSTDGVVDQVLTMSATGVASWVDNGSGDVSGPGTGASTIDNIATFSDVDGNIKDSTVSINDLVKGPTPGSDITNTLAVYATADGKTIKETDYTVPTADGLLNEVLRTDGNGVLSWSSAGSGDVTGPAAGTANTAALLDSTGKILSRSPYTLPTALGTQDFVLTADAGGNVIWSANGSGDVSGPGAGNSTAKAIPTFVDTSGTLLADSNLLYDDVSSTLSGALSIESQDFKLFSSDSGSISLKAPGTAVTDYTLVFPDTVAPSADQILQSDGSGNLSWIPTPTGTGDVTGPVTPTIMNSVALYSDALGKDLTSTDYSFPIASGTTGQVLTVNISGNAEWSNTGSGDVIGPASNLDSTIAIWDGDDSKTLTQSSYTIPLTDGTDGQALVTDGNGTTSWGLVQSLIKDWQATTSYVKDEITVFNGDTIFRARQDYTSLGSAPEDLFAGNVDFLAPPPSSTGVTDGGVVNLNGITVDVTQGDGIIADYSQGLLPVFDYVSWNSVTSLTLQDAGGDNTIYVEPSGTPGVLGTVKVLAGAAPTGFEYTNIVLAIVNPSTDISSSQRTFPSDPVSQTRTLSKFLGTLKKGMAYGGNSNLTFNRSAGALHSWGANWGPINPNQLDFSVVGGVIFRYSTGQAIESTTSTLLNNTQYQKDGTENVENLGGQHPLTYSRVYQNFAGDVVLLYGQSQYKENEEDKALAAISEEANSLVVPDVLREKYQWVATVITNRASGDSSTYTWQNCGIFGCGQSGGGSTGGGGGNVFGPGTSVDNGIALFDGTIGNTIKSTPYNIPDADGNSNQILQTDGSGNVTWQDPSVVVASDERVKENIQPLESNKDKILDLNPVSYKYKFKKDKKDQVGLIAQEVMDLFPEIVIPLKAPKNSGIKGPIWGIDYTKLIVPLVKAFQEQEAELKVYKEKVRSLEERMERLEKLLLEK
ncbi:MAG: hypothetical protein DRQ89_13755, partial [Epsilonproteobacteria bacterium]